MRTLEPVGALLIAKDKSVRSGTPSVGDWADRGWYLALEYGVLARDRFLTRLPKIRGLGRFSELLEPGGVILYRNLFREDQVEAAWELLTLLRPWQAKVVCYLNGEEVPLKEGQDVLWCAAFLAKERPCRAPEKKKDRAAGCAAAEVLLGAGKWKLEESTRRHALTFTSVDEGGVLRFDRDAMATFVHSGDRARRCPASPARDPQAFAAAFEEVTVRSLGWPLVAEQTRELTKLLGTKALEAEHAFVLKKGLPDLETHEALELSMLRGKPAIRKAGERGTGSLASEMRLPVAVKRVLEAGYMLRAVRMQEAYARRAGGHYELEQRFVISKRVHLLAGDRAKLFKGYTLTTHPRSTPEYTAWIERVVVALP